MQTSSNRAVKSIDTMFAIVETLRRLDGAGVTQVAEELGLAKSSAHAHLDTLYRNEFVVKTDGTYHIGLRFMDFGMFARDRQILTSLVQPTLDQMAAETQEIAWFVVEEHGRAVYLLKSSGEQAVQTQSRVGSRVHLHYTAAGKAILSALPNERVQEIIDRHGLPRMSPQTITDSEVLFEELENIRERGFAFNEGEELTSIRAVGVPVRFDGDVLGSISVSSPAKRMTGDRFRERVPELLLGASNEIELKLAYERNR